MNPIRAVLERAIERPDDIAVKSATREFTNAVFADTVKRIAAKLRLDGIRPGSVVGVRLDPFLSTVFLAALLHEGATSFVARTAILEAYSDEIDFVVTDELIVPTSTATTIRIDPDWLDATGRVSPHIEPHDFGNDGELVHLVFSSGTTGTPKGVPFTLRDLERRTAAARENWMPYLPFLSELGLDTVSGMQTYFWSVFTGHTYLIPGAAVDDAVHIARDNVASIKTSPAKLKDLEAAVRLGGIDVSSVTTIEVAGSLLSTHLAHAVSQTFDAELVYLYGSTEAGTITRAVFDVRDPQRVGQVVPTARVEIVGEHGNPLDGGTVGTVRLQSDYQATRYWPFTSDVGAGFRDGWFYPGDTGYLDADGTLVITGRTDELINASGLKINPAWVESQIGDYRGISDVACFALSNVEDGSSELAVAFVATGEINVERFIGFLGERLGDSAPRHVFRIAEIPRNALGKVARLELARRVEIARNERNSL